MSINFQCPHCKARHSAADFAAGRRIRCPSCDTMIEVPQPDAVEVAAAPADHKTLTEHTAPIATAVPSGAPESRALSDASPPLEKPRFGDRDKKRTTDGEMDMTPMVDVVFNLLIFFMVTATFVQQRSLEHPKPEISDQPSTQVMQIEDNPDYITVLVDENNTFFVSTVDWEKECAGEQELLAQLREAKEARGSSSPTKLLVKAHVDATHEYVVMALDAGTAVGIEEVQVVTVEESI